MITAGKGGWESWGSAVDAAIKKQTTVPAAGTVLQVAVDLLKTVK
jgi:hypothetical protein